MFVISCPRPVIKYLQSFLLVLAHTEERTEAMGLQRSKRTGLLITFHHPFRCYKVVCAMPFLHCGPKVHNRSPILDKLWLPFHFQEIGKHFLSQVNLPQGKETFFFVFNQIRPRAHSSYDLSSFILRMIYITFIMLWRAFDRVMSSEWKPILRLFSEMSSRNFRLNLKHSLLVLRQSPVAVYGM